MTEAENELFYQSIIRSYTDENPRFLRRENLGNEISRSINQDSVRFVLITGAPMTGKSTIMAQLARDHPNWLRYFIRRDQISPLGEPGVRSFLMQSGFQFAALRPELFKPTQIQASVKIIVSRIESSGSVVAARINKISASPFVQTILEVSTQVDEVGGELRGLEVGEWVCDPHYLSPNDLAELAIFHPARTLQEQSGGNLVILIDALDELRYYPQPESLLDWLERLGEFPENVRFVLSSRDDEVFLGGLCRAQGHRLIKINLDEDQDAQNDVRTYAAHLAREKPIRIYLKDKQGEFVEQAIIKAGSNLGYLDFLARAIDLALLQNDEIQLQALLELGRLPATLHGLYAHFLDQLRRSVEHEVVEITTAPGNERRYLRTWPAVIKKMLSVLTVVRRPLDINQLVAQGDILAQEDYIHDCLSRMLQYLDTPPGRYRLFHPSLGEYLETGSLRADPSTAPLYVNSSLWHRQIADYYRLSFRNDWSECDDYGLEYTLYHVLNADLSLDELENTVSELITE